MGINLLETNNGVKGPLCVSSCTPCEGNTIADSRIRRLSVVMLDTRGERNTMDDLGASPVHV